METGNLMRRWLEHTQDTPLLWQELRDLFAANDAAGIYDRFYQELSFGTGGLRGVMGAGTNRMNLYTVRKAAQGLALWLKHGRDQRPVAIAYDSRHHSESFARETARVLAANGVFVWLFPRLQPTPALSFAVRRLACAAGVCITASHNPARYNGFKVYGPDGGQLTPAAASAVAARIALVDPFDDVRLCDFDAAVEVGMVRYIREETLNAYLSAVLDQTTQAAIPHQPFSVVYSPLNGAGRECVNRVLDLVGVKELYTVPEQAYPDGDFPTCPSPNPEQAEAFRRALRLARKTNADLALLTDPDCDRVGVAVRHGGDYQILSGNQVGVLLLDYICRRRISAGKMPARPLAVKTLVSTGMARQIAGKYGVELVEVPTGFKYIGEQIALLEAAGSPERFLFGFEESCGYLAGTEVRDKDGVAACMLVSEMARDYKSRGITLYDALQQLYGWYGYYVNQDFSFTYPGEAGARLMRDMLGHLRTHPVKSIGGVAVAKTTDFLNPRGPARRGNTGPGSAPGHLALVDMLEYHMEDGGRVCVRPSGTEPKIKLYVEAHGPEPARAEHQAGQLAAGMKALLGMPEQTGPEPLNTAAPAPGPFAARQTNQKGGIDPWTI